MREYRPGAVGMTARGMENVVRAMPVAFLNPRATLNVEHVDVAIVSTYLRGVEAVALGLPEWFQKADGDHAVSTRVVLILGLTAQQLERNLMAVGLERMTDSLMGALVRHERRMQLLRYRDMVNG